MHGEVQHTRDGFWLCGGGVEDEHADVWIDRARGTHGGGIEALRLPEGLSGAFLQHAAVEADAFAIGDGE